MDIQMHASLECCMVEGSYSQYHHDTKPMMARWGISFPYVLAVHTMVPQPTVVVIVVG